MHLPPLVEMLHVWTFAMIEEMGYLGLGLVMFLENVFPPIPSEVILPLAGSLTVDGTLCLLRVTAAGAGGSVGGAWVFYGLGRWLGEGRVRRLIRQHGRWLCLGERDLDRAMAWFGRHGERVVLFGRLVPVVRSLISVPAGVARMDPLRFTAYTVLGTALWSLLLALAGRLLGENWGAVSHFVSRYQTAVLAGLGLALAVYLARRPRR